MDPHALPADAVAAMRHALAGERLDASYEAFVRRHVGEPDAGWRSCCGSSCDPCVQRLGRVVDAVRRALCTSGTGSAGTDPAPGLPHPRHEA